MPNSGLKKACFVEILFWFSGKPSKLKHGGERKIWFSPSTPELDRSLDGLRGGQLTPLPFSGVAKSLRTQGDGLGQGAVLSGRQTWQDCHRSQVALVFIAFIGSERLGGNDVTTLGILACFILGIENGINSKADSHSGLNLLKRKH